MGRGRVSGLTLVGGAHMPTGVLNGAFLGHGQAGWGNWKKVVIVGAPLLYYFIYDITKKNYALSVDLVGFLLV